MARQGRRTEPSETLHGVVENYAEIEELLSDGEMSKPTDHDILDLHRAMFGEFLEWAGTTRRVLDHYNLWVTFRLHSDSLETSPSIEYFPSEHHEDEYYEGLLEADLNRPERLRAFFLERLMALFDDVQRRDGEVSVIEGRFQTVPLVHWGRGARRVLGFASACSAPVVCCALLLGDVVWAFGLGST